MNMNQVKIECWPLSKHEVEHTMPGDAEIGGVELPNSFERLQGTLGSQIFELRISRLVQPV